ncbi:MAG TPA: hypothetical protein VM734_17065 [Kofleriaceae bacterium]|nr:hypothetical protein [Kofleriaceae bacterium]
MSIRLNLQITLSNLPIVEEWMDIHLDRWLEHVPTPPEMPSGHAVSYLAMLGADLKRMWWGAWGDPAGLVPKLADYLKLCNIAKSDAAILDQMGEKLEPRLVGSWVGVWGGRVSTGWHFLDPQPWTKLEPLFGTHEAKFLLKNWLHDAGVDRVERFTQAIGEGSFSEIEVRMPGATVDEQVGALVTGFAHFGGGDLPAPLVAILRGAPHPTFGLSVRIRGGQVVRVAAIAPGMPLDVIQSVCTEMKLGAVDAKLERLINTLASEGVSKVEIGRAGERGGVDVYVEPTQAAAKPAPGAAKPADAVN